VGVSKNSENYNLWKERLSLANTGKIRSLETKQKISDSKKRDAIPRFWEKVEKTTTCWNWIAFKDKDGYGKFKPTITECVRAHRFSYELIKGEIPEGLQLDHICKNKACVNPAHLEIVTCDENIKRADNQLTTINSKKTHCPLGHPLSDHNLYINCRGRRECRTCLKARKDKFYENHKTELQDKARSYQREKRPVFKS